MNHLKHFCETVMIMNRIKKIIGLIILNLRYITSLKYVEKIKKLGYKIMSIDETIDFISIPGNSMVRFGDGEIDLINGVDIKGYQKANSVLAKRLEEIALLNEKKMLICFPDSLVNLEDKKKNTKKHWVYSFKTHYIIYSSLCRKDYNYGNSFVSRPYIIYKDIRNADGYFLKLINIFKDKDIVIIEGEYSRSGVGNNLFSKAKSVKRVICPASNAFDKYEEILSATNNIAIDTLILVALGPTAKPLCVDLFKKGYWVLDIGHIDSEYEWFLRKSSKKVVIGDKHTAEYNDENISNCTDKDYLESIVISIK